MKNSKFLKVLAIFLVVALAVSAGFLFQGKSLKAADEEAVQVEAPAAPEPVVEVQEIVVSEEVAAPVVDEAAEEGEPAAETEEAAEPVDGEDAEEVEDAEDAEEAEDEEEEEEEEEEEVEKINPVGSIYFVDVNGGKLYVGDVVRVCVQFAEDYGVDFSYQWQFNDGSGWQNAPNGNGAYCEYVVDKTNIGYTWQVIVTWTVEE